MKKQRSLFTVNQVLENFSAGPTTGIFTDGSCSGNPGPGGWGVVMVLNNEIIIQKHGHNEYTTNNQMELTALREGLLFEDNLKEIDAFTDSQLLVNTFNSWASEWERMGWRRKSGPIKNLELVKEIFYLIKERKNFTLNWIPAHSGYKWNEYADSLSTAYLRDVL